MSDLLKRNQKRLIGHGAALIFLGGVLGFAFLFFLIGKIALWPLPGEISFQMPGSYDAWRMAHMEAIINGLILWLMAAIIHLLPFSPLGQTRIANGLIVVGWTFVIASSIDPLFAESRGLAFGGPLSNQLAFFLFYIGVVLVMIITALIAWRSLFKNE